MEFQSVKNMYKELKCEWKRMLWVHWVGETNMFKSLHCITIKFISGGNSVIEIEWAFDF